MADGLRMEGRMKWLAHELVFEGHTCTGGCALSHHQWLCGSRQADDCEWRPNQDGSVLDESTAPVADLIT